MNDHEAIAQRAYARWKARGGTPGHELEDWLQAEQENCDEETPA